MSQNRPQSKRRRPESSQQVGPPAWLYVAIVTAVVVSMIFAAISTVDFSGFLGNEEPTPDYTGSSIDAQREVVNAHPDDAAARAMLASLLAHDGQLPESIREYERALELDPENATIRLDFARTLQNYGRPQDAEIQFLRVLEIEPENHSAHYYLARLYMDWQPRRQADAIPHFEAVIAIAPNSFLAGQAQSVLDTLDLATPIASPQATP